MPPRIDAHQHFWRYQPADYPWIGPDLQAELARDRLPADLRPLLQAHQLEGAIAVQARANRAETEFLLGLAATHRWIWGVVGWEDVSADDLPDRLDAWRGREPLVGFRHQVQDEADVPGFLTAPAFARGIAMLQARGYTYDVLVLDHQLPAVAAFCARHDEHMLVLDHLGKPALRIADADADALDRWRTALQPLRDQKHVSCKLSGLLTEADWRSGVTVMDKHRAHLCLDTALEVFGPKRLMFGSDWPVCLLASDYAQAVDLIDSWARTRLSSSEQAQLWGGTATRVYNLERRS